MAHAKRAFAQLPNCDAAMHTQLSKIVDDVAAAPHSEQHPLVGQLMSLLGGLPNARELGFMLGKQIPITAFGDLALGFKIAPTFSDAIRLVAKYHHREAPLVLYSYMETATEGRFTIGFRCPIDSKGEALLVSAAVGLIERELSRIAGHGGNLKEVQLTSSSAGWESAYHRHVSITPKTDRDTNTIVFDKAVLDLPNPIADADTFDGVVSEYEQKALLQDSITSPSVRIRELVMSNISDPPALGSLSKSLRLTQRQLRLALTRDGTNYQEIVKSCRVEYASALFRNPA
ncbi:MAG: AraC family transcriptional regulator, partial [Pseudomonadota bacterium]|nr:AraC family transcriptional regulator [Pseudomonadota bacterium]